jgi:hypothetical protein
MNDRDRREREARRDLERLGDEGGFLNSPAMRSKAKSFRDHFAARDVDQTDPIEVSATRTGRILSLVAFIGLALWLASGLW